MEVQMSEEKKRRPFRVIFKLLVFLGLAAAVAKVLGAKKDELFGLTESEAREKFEQKLASRIGEDVASEIANQVIPKLKEKGVIKDDPAPSASDEDTSDEEMAGSAEEASSE